MMYATVYLGEISLSLPEHTLTTRPQVQALQQARDYWEKFKWDIIATKMLDFGCSEKWPAKYCIRKWEDLHPDLDMSKEKSASERGTPEALTPRPQ